MLLSSILSKIYSEKDINANLITIMSENYSLVPLYKGIEFTDPYSNQIHVFNKNYIIKRIINPLASPNAGASALKYGDVNTLTPSPGEIKGLMRIKIIILL